MSLSNSIKSSSNYHHCYTDQVTYKIKNRKENEIHEAHLFLLEMFRLNFLHHLLYYKSNNRDVFVHLPPVAVKSFTGLINFCTLKKFVSRKQIFLLQASALRRGKRMGLRQLVGIHTGSSISQYIATWSCRTNNILGFELSWGICMEGRSRETV